ncbi:MAG: TIR domain-containing protein [Leptolyngbya sp. SIO3F4]|nr:TIR domain-containing protein [Leptolyngbya sp. SIO3F4]
MIRIFLAYASEDKEKVVQLYNRLKQRGFEPWLDKKNLKAGQNWRSEIPKAIKNSDIFLACLSLQSINKKGYVQKEFKIALDKYAELPQGTVYLIPIRLDKCEIPDFRLNEYGCNLRDIHGIDFFESDGFEKLVESIEFHFPEAIRKVLSSRKSRGNPIFQIRGNPIFQIRGNPIFQIRGNSILSTKNKIPRARNRPLVTGPLITLNLGQGNCETGLPDITARLWLEGSQLSSQYKGNLPTVTVLPRLYRKWKQLYEALHSSPFGFGQSNFRNSIEFEQESLTNVSRADFRDLCDKLKVEINHWLNSSGFQIIEQQLRTKLGAEESIRLIIETDDLFLQKLPWHLWHFLETYDKAEVALSFQEYKQVNSPSPSPSPSPSYMTRRMRILVILGCSAGVNTHPDRMILEDADAETLVLKEPSRSELDKCLWDKRGWDIFFFAGHSTSGSDGQAGELFLNSDERLSIGPLKHALTASIKRGLKLAIFNSCDGLGLARDLAALNLPQIVVMREPVVDQVAQTFLRNFLRVFSDGEPFYTAVRQAREQLQGIEGKFPCASWLPVIFQNPTVTPITWDKSSGYW